MDRRRRLFFAGACWLGICGSALFGQEPMTPTLPPTTVEGTQPMTPTLPPTTVEGNQPAAAQDPFGPSGNPFDNFGDDFGGDPSVDGSRFGSPIEAGYSGTNSTTGSIIALPDADIAGTVNVINRNVLTDQQVLSFSDLVRNAGAVTASGDGRFQDAIFIRGLLMQTRDYRKDGFLDPTIVPRDFQNVERVEILKGPASSMYGAANPAGLVNVITKKPLDATFAEAGFTFGSFERQRYTVDANSRVTDDGAVLFRLNAAHEDTNGFRDFDYLSRTDITPVVTWNIDNCSRITYSADWHRDYRRGDQGYPSVGDNPFGYPSNFYAGNPTATTGFFGNPIPADNIRYEEFRQTVMYTNELNDCWTFNLGGNSLFYSYPGSITIPGADQTGFGINPLPGGLYYKQPTQFAAAEQSQSAIANLAGDFNTGEFNHKMVIGSEYVYFDSNTQFSLNQDLLPAGSLNGAPPYSPGGFNFPLGVADFPAYRQTRFGAYLQDLMEVTPEWKLVGGMRFDTINVNFDRTLPPNPLLPPFIPPVASINDEYTRLTPRGGVIYQPWADESLACYFNYSQSFTPPSPGLYYSNGPQVPVTGDSFELGIKSLVMEGLTVNVAGFYTDRKNVDIGLQPFFFTQVGAERTKGVEVNILGQLSERTNVVANYAYVDCRLYDDGFFQPVPINGNRQRNVPYNSANFWLRHNLIQDDCQTVGVAGGLVYQDARPVDIANTFNLPAYCRVDGGLFYTRGQVSANLYAENIGDIDYIAASQSTFQLFPGAPGNVRATVSYLY